MTEETRPHHRPRPRRGFTLLELVIVVGVILVLMGLALGVGSMVVAQSETRQLNATMTIVDSAMSEFENQTGRPLVFEGAYQAGSVYRYDHVGHPAVEYEYGGNAPADFGVYYDVPYRPFQDQRFTLDLEDGGFGWNTLDVCTPWRDELGLVRRQWMAATLAVLMQNQTCAEMLAKADPALLHTVQCVVGGSSSGATVRSLDQKEFIDPWQQQVYIVFPGRAFDDRDRGSSNAQSAQRDIRDSDGTIRTVEELRYGICRNQRPLLVSAGPDARFGNLLADPSDQDFADAQDNIYSYEPDQP